MTLYGFRKLTYKKNQKKIKIDLFEGFDKIYSGEALLNSKHEIKQLQSELEHKGLSFPKNWMKADAFTKNK